MKKNYSFPSWGEFVGFCRDAKPHADSDKGSARNKGDAAFHGTASFEEAVVMAAAGWPEMAARASLAAAPYYKSLSNLVARDNIEYDIQGSGIDCGRFVEGIPECWQRFEESIIHGKSNRVLRMIVDVGAHCMIDAKTMEIKGGYALALLDLLELSGYRVEVIFGFAGHYKDVSLECSCLAKPADQPPDKNRLAYILAHPSAYRRLGFAVLEQHFEPKLGLGRCGNYPGKPGDILIPNSNRFQGRSPDEVQEMLKQELVRQGVIKSPKGGL